MQVQKTASQYLCNSQSQAPEGLQRATRWGRLQQSEEGGRGANGPTLDQWLSSTGNYNSFIL